MSDTMFFSAQMAILGILADGAQPSGKLYALLLGSVTLADYEYVLAVTEHAGWIARAGRTVAATPAGAAMGRRYVELVAAAAELSAA